MDVHTGSQIPDPVISHPGSGSRLQGSKKSPDPGSATQNNTFFFTCCHKAANQSIKAQHLLSELQTLAFEPK